jgi:magnesium transporter
MLGSAEGQTRTMDGRVFTGGSTSVATAASVRQLVDAGQFFWLDLESVDDEVLGLLGDVFQVHQLALEDVRHFGQRPKCDDYGTFTHLVAYGAAAQPFGTEEVHFLFAEHFVVTVHHGPCGAMDDARNRLAHRAGEPNVPPQIAVIYLVIDELVDSFFPMLDGFDNQIDDLEDAVLVRPTDAQLGTLFTMKRSLIGVRKVITPQRDVFAGITSGVIELPGVNESGLRYLRDVYDHLIRISDLVDGYRDLLSGVMDTHLSTVSNRLNVVMKQLTIIATVFLPLSFLTGWFGQNFSYLVAHITGRVPFYGLAVGLEVLSALVLLYFFRRRGWLGGPTE